MLSAQLPNLKMGAIIDDRNLRGNFNDTIKACEMTVPYDHMSGHSTQHEKTVFLTTSENDRERLQLVQIDGHQPKHATSAVIVGDLITTMARKATSHNNNKMQAATQIANRIGKAPVSNFTSQQANRTATIPKAISSTQWTAASNRAVSSLRTAILRGN